MQNKTILLLLMVLCFSIRGQSQAVIPFILNSTGGVYQSGSSYTQLEWSFGELAIIDTYTTPNLITTNGLLQPCTDKVFRDPEIFVFGLNEYKIFPNVTQGPFELDFFLNISGQMNLQLTDALGRVINTRRFQYGCCTRIERYDLTGLPNGAYFINVVFVPDGHNADDIIVKRASTFKIIKSSK
ncbi:hypothetical protein ACFOWM_02955 [Ferruginibacter yonginensis]|uniref:Secretion system C-terminal sorting domain-containing protein n=1 Tax=Ferruginibacter yonginensis TaxID=1310416 RepID=A0ABV8QNN1_9BACT